MKRTISIAISRSIALVLALIFAGSAFAAEFTAFGPVVFERQKGKPVAETLEFPEPAFGRDFMMTITNGDERGKNRVSAADVALNGNRIAGPSDFNRTVGKIVRPVSLNAVNTLSALVEGAPGGFITVVVAGTFYEPSVTAFTVFPQTVQAGESAELSWRTVNAEVCSIAPGVGEVPGSGSMAVTPSETTTYTLTATNASGTTTANAAVTVVHPEPTVSISAEPTGVYAGESVTLTWESSHAVSAVIDQGVGAVPVSGSVVVNPLETTTYVVEATGPGGSAAADVTVNVVSPISVQITPPEEGASVGSPSIMVRGIVTNDAGNDTAVIVNGIPAMRSGNEFIANHVLVPEGDSEILIMAGDAAGNVYQTSYPVHVEMPEHHFLLVSEASSGVPPFETDLKIKTSLNLVDSDLAYTGPGFVEITGVGPYDFTIKITGAGVYCLTATAWDGAGGTYSDTIAVAIADPDELDAMLRRKWDAMKTRLASGDIDGAVEYFLPAAQDRYAQIYSAIGSDLPDFVSQMENIEPVYFRGSLAKYRIRRNESINGEMHAITYYIHFAKGLDGLWYIESF